MNRTSMSFAIKHLFAGAVLVGLSLAVTIAGYLGLLAWAIVANGDLGGPLALPSMVLIVFGISLSSVLLLLLPATTLAEKLSPTKTIRSHLLQILLSSLLLLAYVAVGLTVAAVVFDWQANSTIRSGVFFAGIELVLLGIYWWSLQVADVAISLLVRTWRRLRAAGVASGVSGL